MTAAGTFADIFAYCLIFISFAVTPLFFYISYILFNYHGEMYFLKRGIIFLVPQLILSFVLLVAVRPMLVAVNFLNYNLIISIELIRSLNSLLLYGIINIEIARVGYYFVQIYRVTQATIIAESASSPHHQSSFITISNNTDTNPKNGCIKSILHFISSQKRMFILVLIFWLFESAISIIMIDNLVFNEDNINGLTRIISVGIACIVGLSYAIVIFIAVRNKVFQFQDNWYITQEFRKVGKIIAYHVLFGALLLVAEVLIPSRYEEIIKIVELCWIPLYLSLGICFCYVTFIWVWKVNEKNANYARSQLSLRLNANSVTSSRTYTGSTTQSASDRDSININVESADNTDSQNKIELTSKTSEIRKPNTNKNGKKKDWKRSGGLKKKKKKKKQKKVHVMNGLENFWDKSIDIKQDYENIKIEFVKFSNHCVSELNIENLLFFVNCVQLLEFLIDKKYFNVNNDDDLKIISPMIHTWSVSHFMKDTNTITRLKMAYDLFDNDDDDDKDDEDDDNDHDNGGSKKEVNFSIFGAYYMDIYERFVQRDKAPFEINIAHKPRQRFEQYYHDIHTNGTVVTKEYFHTIWKDLKHAALHVYGLLDQPFNRFTAQLE